MIVYTCTSTLVKQSLRCCLITHLSKKAYVDMVHDTHYLKIIKRM